MIDTVVVGGGVGGLAAAHAAMARGDDVVLLEATDRLGGMIRSERKQGFLCEWGANALLDSGTPDPDGAVALAERVGVALEPAGPAARQRWVFLGGRLRAVPTGPKDLLRSDLLSWKGKLRALYEPLVPRRGSVEDDESVASFFARRFGDEAAHALAGPFTVGVYAGEASDLGVRAAFPRLVALEDQHGSLVRGMFKSRKAGTPRPRPRSLAPAEGMEALPRALGRALGNRVRLGTRVTRLEGQAGALTLRLADRSGTPLPPITARRVILATPARITASLAATLDGELGALCDVPVARVAVAVVGLKRSSVPHPLGGFGFLVAREERPRVLGLIMESEVFPGRAPEGQVLLRMIYGGGRDPGLLQLGDEAIAQVALDDLATTLGVRTTPTLLEILRPGEGLPQPRPGHVARVAAARARGAQLGLGLVGNAWGGIALADVVRGARRA